MDGTERERERERAKMQEKEKKEPIQRKKSNNTRRRMGER
jgi:hypothetical protein